MPENAPDTTISAPAPEEADAPPPAAGGATPVATHAFIGHFPPALYVIATPIGHLGDLTLRAHAMLPLLDAIACEDTRTTRQLLQAHGLKSPELFAYNEHNADRVTARLTERLQAGQRIGLVSDAGTPLISDPGRRLVEAARGAGLRVVPVPGASAPLAALMGAGFPSENFTFLGFLPSKENARRAAIEAQAAQTGTLLFFEAPHRLVESLESLRVVLGDAREVCVARELTKRYEEFRRASLGELCAHYAQAEAPRGEIVLLVAPADMPEKGFAPDADLTALAAAGLAHGLPLGQVADALAGISGLPRKPIYQWLLQCKNAH